MAEASSADSKAEPDSTFVRETLFDKEMLAMGLPTAFGASKAIIETQKKDIPKKRR